MRNVLLALSAASVIIISGGLYAGRIVVPQWIYTSLETIGFETGGCLLNGENAVFEVENNYSKEYSYVNVSKMGGENAKTPVFREKILQPQHYHPVEAHKCAVYFVQGVNYDPASLGRSLQGFREELVAFDYRGKKIFSMILAEKPDKYVSYYSNDFRVNPSETHVALEDNHDLNNKIFLIKSLGTKNDHFSLPLATIANQNENLVGDIMFLDWTRDGRYFWASLFEAAYVNGWVRVDSNDWSYELYEAPEGVLGGYPLNIASGWVPVIPGAFWTGVVELDDEVRQERSASGETADLYLYNVITKTRILVEDTDAPIWRGLKAHWLSDTELEYTMPDGTKKTYRVSSD